MSRQGAPSAVYGFLQAPPGPWVAAAACAGRAPLHDPPTGPADKGAALQARLAEARAVCSACPVLQDCRAWTEETPRAKVAGVLAGVFFPVIHVGDPGYYSRKTAFPVDRPAAA